MGGSMLTEQGEAGGLPSLPNSFLERMVACMLSSDRREARHLGRDMG